jgi:hypothetical protein
VFYEDPSLVEHMIRVGESHTTWFSFQFEKKNGFLDLWTEDIQYTVVSEYEGPVDSMCIFVKIVKGQDDIPIPSKLA